jgi:hypothetical protein
MVKPKILCLQIASLMKTLVDKQYPENIRGHPGPAAAGAD